MAKTLRAKCLEAAQKLARISAADEHGYCKCVSCGKVDHYKNMDGGHFIPKGKSSYWSLKIENVKPQCKSCNGFGMRYGTASQSYTLWMQDYYGKEFVEEMLATTSKPCKMYKKDYEDLLKEFNDLIKYHEGRIS